MNWKYKFCGYLILSIPAFSGYPLTVFDAELLSGITIGWVAYLGVVFLFILAINGSFFLANILAITAVITLPVVFAGSAISYFISLTGLGYADGQSAYSAHYVALCISMLTVVPLALSLVSVIPFHDFEQNLLKNRGGVSRIEKFALMILRVFNHIVYFVIPNILEALREEGRFRQWADYRSHGISAGGRSPLRLFRYMFNRLLKDMVQLGVEGICASIQYVPLWAVEISRLPDKPQK